MINTRIIKDTGTSYERVLQKQCRTLYNTSKRCKGEALMYFKAILSADDKMFMSLKMYCVENGIDYDDIKTSVKSLLVFMHGYLYSVQLLRFYRDTD